MSDKTASERIDEAFARMSEPIELKVGQVWKTQNGRAEIVAVGPDFIGYRKIPGGFGIADIGHFRRWAIYPLPPKPPKHVLWVNMFRGGNGDIFLRQTATREEADLRAAQTSAMIHANTVRIACFQLEFEEGAGL